MVTLVEEAMSPEQKRLAEKHKAVRCTCPAFMPVDVAPKFVPHPDQIYKNMYFKYFAVEAEMSSFADERRKAGDKVDCTTRPDGSFSACVFER